MFFRTNSFFFLFCSILFLVSCLSCKGNKSQKRVYREYLQFSNQVAIQNDRVTKNKKMNVEQVVSNSIVKSEFDWEVPAGWQVKPQDSVANSPRLITLILPNGSECTITVFSGTVGNFKANTVRWLRQMGKNDFLQTPEKSKQIATFVQEKIISQKGKLPYYYLDLSYFIDSADSNQQVIIAAIFPLNNQTLFVKLTTNLSDLKQEKENFLKLANSIFHSKK